MIKNINYLQPGDIIKSTTENRHFHRDTNYVVSHCIQSPKGLEIFVTDKYGFDIPLEAIDYQISIKTEKALEDRKRTAIFNYFKNFGVTIEIWRGWDNTDPNKTIRNSIYYELSANALNSVSFMANRKAINKITKYRLDKNEKRYDVEEKYIITDDEFNTYFNNEITENDWEWNRVGMYKWNRVGMYKMSSEMFKYNVFMHYIIIQTFLSSSVALNSPVTYYGRWDSKSLHDISWKEFKTYIADVIFDKKTLDDNELQIIKDIMILYRELPSSHSGTSVSKYLTGKSKVKINKVEQYLGKYSTYKQPMMYELATRVESFLYGKNIFSTKEEYLSGTEWRGNFEFIGSKYVNHDELNKLINE